MGAKLKVTTAARANDGQTVETTSEQPCPIDPDRGRHARSPSGVGDAVAPNAYRRHFELVDLVREFQTTTTEWTARYGMTPQQYHVMLAIAAQAAGATATVGYLAGQLRIQHHSVVGLIDRLLERGFVGREHNPRDRRQVLVRLTPRGAQVLEAIAEGTTSDLRDVARDLVETLDVVVTPQS